MLPGKLCIGILEEDNPLKSYFRLKPLLVESEGKYVIFDGLETYPEEGCIRIVPDKNESSHFKARMRRMGRYCVLDLRNHAGENDKIRPNKNYHGDETEHNAYIVYSDVVREPADDMIFEILPADTAPGAWEGAAPGTSRLLCGNETWVYTPSAEEGEPAQIAPDGASLEEEKLQRFEIPGFPGQTLNFAIRRADSVSSVLGAVPQKSELHSAPAAAAEASKPREAEVQPPEPAAEPEKPWISRDVQPAPQAVHGHMSPIQQALAAQSGLNPKRNRSLQEIIEEKWRHSRVDQLGHPVPANAMGKPVENPLDRAMESLRYAWNIPEIRDRLVLSIAEMAEFSSALDGCRRELSNSAMKRELEDLEAERLKSLAALEKLRREKKALRETFKQEIRQEEAAALRDAVEKTKKAQAELKKFEENAAEARKAAEFAQDAFAALKDGRFEERLREFALTSRAAELLTKPVNEEAAVIKASDEMPDGNEWIARLKRAFAAEGLEVDDAQAANLLVCAALGESLLFSGEASSDKCASARALAKALGAQDTGRYAEISGSVVSQKAQALLEDSELPALVLVRDANSVPGGDVCRGLCAAAENLLVVSALSDSGTGLPVSPEALERGFLIRMEAAGAQTPWKAEMPAAGEFSPVRMNALRSAFKVQAEQMPLALERKLQKIRDALALHNVRISRSTLNLMWDYCAAMLSLGKVPADEVLDYAFAQKALPCILAEAPVECLAALKTILADMPRSLSLLDKPLPILI